jgi:hypothetical protein
MDAGGNDKPTVEIGSAPEWEPTRCLLCEKMFELSPQEAMLHGTLAAPVPGSDYVCANCARNFKDTALLRCAKCGAAVGRAAPGRLDTGFEIKPKTVLHLDSCSTCDPGVQKSTIVEARLWAESQRRK